MFAARSPLERQESDSSEFRQYCFALKQAIWSARVQHGNAKCETKSSTVRKTSLVAAFAAVALLSVAVLPMAAQATTLTEALAAAYRYNPQLDAERARLRATDEGVSQAHAGYRPNINATGDVSVQQNNTRLDDQNNTGFGGGGIGSINQGGNVTTYPRGVGVTLQQNLFNGFQTVNGVREAEANVRAGRAILENVERQILLLAATAYMDVLRDQAIVRLRENNVSVLTRTLRATQDRFGVGEVTRTDVAQAQATRAASLSDLDLARANLKTSRATYERVVGSPPSRLTSATLPSRLLPKSLTRAISIGEEENPLVITSLYLEQGARISVDRIRGELLPSFDLEASYQNRFNSSEFVRETDQTTVVGRLTVPIYQGGAVYSRVRQAKHTHVSRIQEIEQTRTEVREAVTAAWSQLVAARARLTSNQVQVDANQTALSGVREEEKVGQRTLLDVLEAEQTFLDAQVSLETTRRDVVVAAYTVLAEIGRLEADRIGAVSTVYIPEEHYFEVRRKWWGLDITHDDGRSEHVDMWESHGRHHPSK